MQNHNVTTFDLGSAKMFLLPCLRAISLIAMIKALYGLLQLFITCTLPCCAICNESYTSVNSFCTFMTSILLIAAASVLLNCLVLILCLCIHFPSLKCYCFCSLLCKFVMVASALSMGCGVLASLILFLNVHYQYIDYTE